MRKKTIQAIVIVFFVMISALASSCNKDDTTIVELLRTWTLESSGKIGDELPVLQNTEITLEFDDAQNIQGTACNYYSGRYEVKDDGTIFLTQIAMTDMACITPEGIMEQETNYTEALAGVSSYEVVQERLRLYYDDGQSVLNYSIKQED